jgi:hydroxymethylpyrimidine pyrophosphatase-like HAD family hydrolase
MDGTVIPLDRGPGRTEDIRAFSEAIGAVPGLALAYVTGRSLSLALRGVEEFHLPPADYLAVDVGTRIHVRTPGGYSPDPNYDARMAKALGGLELAEACRTLEGTPGLSLQPEWGQGRFKRSYFVDPSLPEEEILEGVGSALAREGARANLVTSHDPLRDVGLLDILPRGVAKDEAVRHLRELTDTPMDRVVYAGDSGNDWGAFLAGYSGIVVGNAPESLKARLRRIRNGRGDRLRIFFAEAPFAAGVVEGMRHYRVV